MDLLDTGATLVWYRVLSHGQCGAAKTKCSVKKADGDSQATSLGTSSHPFEPLLNLE